MAKLNEKNQQILDLLIKGKKIKDIAKTLNTTPQHICNLKAGEATKGQQGQFFHAEYNKKRKDLDKETDGIIKEANHLCHKKLHTWIRSLNPNDIKTKVHHKQLIDAINALSKAPIVNIGITMKLSDKEWEDEFNRITALARATALSRRVQGLERRREDTIPPIDSTKDSGGESLQNPEIPTKPESEEVSPE